MRVADYHRTGQLVRPCDSRGEHFRPLTTTRIKASASAQRAGSWTRLEPSPSGRPTPGNLHLDHRAIGRLHLCRSSSARGTRRRGVCDRPARRRGFLQSRACANQRRSSSARRSGGGQPEFQQFEQWKVVIVIKGARLFFAVQFHGNESARRTKYEPVPASRSNCTSRRALLTSRCTAPAGCPVTTGTARSAAPASHDCTWTRSRHFSRTRRACKWAR